MAQHWLESRVAGGSRKGIERIVSEDWKGSKAMNWRLEKRHPTSCTGRNWVTLFVLTWKIENAPNRSDHRFLWDPYDKVWMERYEL